MNKKILAVAIVMISTNAMAIDLYRHKIPQPNFVSNDWDGDGEVNAVDTDDDNDGIPDISDSNPFSPDGQVSTPSGGSGGGSGGSGGGTGFYTGTVCSAGTLSTDTITALNSWSGLSHTSASWCALSSLAINGQSLTTVPDEIGALSNLVALDLDNNNISNFPSGGIGDLNLTTLSLSYNSLTEIPDSIRDNPELLTFRAIDNPMTTISANISDLTVLQVLDIHGHVANSLPNSIQGMSTLQEIYVLDQGGSPYGNINCESFPNLNNEDSCDNWF